MIIIVNFTKCGTKIYAEKSINEGTKSNIIVFKIYISQKTSRLVTHSTHFCKFSSKITLFSCLVSTLRQNTFAFVGHN